jgi:hypothetical protein
VAATGVSPGPRFARAVTHESTKYKHALTLGVLVFRDSRVIQRRPKAGLAMRPFAAASYFNSPHACSTQRDGLRAFAPRRDSYVTGSRYWLAAWKGSDATVAGVPPTVTAVPGDTKSRCTYPSAIA